MKSPHRIRKRPHVIKTARPCRFRHAVLFHSRRSFVAVPVLVAAPMVFVTLFGAKMFTKIAGLFPTVKAFKYQREEDLYYTLMMSTGLTFGTISALFGFTHGVITQTQYSHLVATVIGSAVVPTIAANAWFMPPASAAQEGALPGTRDCRCAKNNRPRRLTQGSTYARTQTQPALP